MKLATISLWCLGAIIISLSADAFGFVCTRFEPEETEKHLSDLKSQITIKFKAFILLADHADPKLNVDEMKSVLFLLSECENLISEFKSCLYDFLYGESNEFYKAGSPVSIVRQQIRLKRQSMPSSEKESGTRPQSEDQHKVKVDDSIINRVAKVIVDHVLNSTNDSASKLVADLVSVASELPGTTDPVFDTSSENLGETIASQIIESLGDAAIQKRAGALRGSLSINGSLSTLRSALSANTNSTALRKRVFPRYTTIPETGFKCDDKKFVPGFYADIKTDCQVFHVCWPRRRESYLCVAGTTFNQKTLTCDTWNKSTCSLSPLYYHYNSRLHKINKPEELFAIDDSIYSELIDPNYDSKRYSHTLSLPKMEVKYVPVAYRTTYYSGRWLHPDTPEFEEFDSNLPPHDKGLGFSPPEIQALSNKIYEILFGEKFPKIETATADESEDIISDGADTVSLQEEHIDPVDRFGDIAIPEIKPKIKSPTNVTEKTLNLIKSPIVKPKAKAPMEMTDVSKEKMTTIVSKALKTSEEIVKKGILPLTKEILAMSYSKLLKDKH